MNPTSRLSTTFALFAAVATAAAVPALAAEFSVRADGLGDFPTVQAAVDVAVAGDTIVLEDGRFVGDGNRDVTFGGKDLVVRSRNGAAACTLDTQGSVSNPHRAFRLDDGETPAARIDGFTIVNGYTTGAFPEVGGAGILVTSNTSPTIANCIFDGNESGFQGFGAGVLAYDGCDVRILDCIFRNGAAGWYGGGVVLRLNSDGIVERCQFLDNFALHAGGGISITNSDAIVTDCLFVDNVIVEASGGAVLVKANALPVFTGCVFAGNKGLLGGAVGTGNYAEVTLIDCLFEGNEADWSGGAILVGHDQSIVHVDNCTLVNNRAGSLASSIRVEPLGNALTIRDSIVRGTCDGLPLIRIDSGASADVDCNLIEGGQGAIVNFGGLSFGPNNRDENPLFCGAKPCGSPSFPTGDWTIDAASPASPTASSCGLVGAFPIACGATSVDAALEAASWGAIKARYLGSGPAAGR